jgi:hypothetical protein
VTLDRISAVRNPAAAIYGAAIGIGLGLLVVAINALLRHH